MEEEFNEGWHKTVTHSHTSHTHTHCWWLQSMWCVTCDFVVGAASRTCISLNFFLVDHLVFTSFLSVLHVCLFVYLFSSGHLASADECWLLTGVGGGASRERESKNERVVYKRKSNTACVFGVLCVWRHHHHQSPPLTKSSFLNRQMNCTKLSFPFSSTTHSSFILFPFILSSIK